MPTLQGFITMMKDPSGWVSAIYYPVTREMFQVNRIQLYGVCPIEAGLVPSEDQLQLIAGARFEDLPY